MVHVGRALATLAGDQIKQGSAGAHLHQFEFLEPALDPKSQRLFVELDHRRKIADPQYDMVDSFDMESHGV